jgi:hypothetical protein
MNESYLVDQRYLPTLIPVLCVVLLLLVLVVVLVGGMETRLFLSYPSFLLLLEERGGRIVRMALVHSVSVNEWTVFFFCFSFASFPCETETQPLRLLVSATTLHLHNFIENNCSPISLFSFALELELNNFPKCIVITCCHCFSP